ncbi:uncharacterized protein EI90DRAFT_3015509 [Cantharellus anzutake]|uniref:uncharacterized protein n=1 Tax=Cantharellus anzutake TaxID=1750568 RepID=UPI0019045F90|nr:uncharacterized protein EI90DRAFT_3015509 [Cantharellus anzutake]KAF8333040.1 hypothetical protein EI90DRAFT_3015509 [Cantharellus anzutake]
MCQLYDGLSTFRFEGERSSNKDVTLSHLMNENLGEDAEMKLEDVEVEVDEVDIHTPKLAGSLIHTQCGALLKNLIGEAVGQKTIGASWGTSKIFPFLLENHLCFKNWHCGVPLLNKKLPSSWSPRESACCIVVLTHERLEIKLEVVKMTPGEMLPIIVSKGNELTPSWADEHERHEVVHYAPDRDGNILAYSLRKNDAVRSTAKVSRLEKRKVASPPIEEDVVETPPQKRQKSVTKGKGRREDTPQANIVHHAGTVPEIMPTDDLHSAKASNNAITTAQTKVEPENIPEAAAFNGLDLADILNDEIFVEASGDMADGGSRHPMALDGSTAAGAPPILIIQPTPSSSPTKSQLTSDRAPVSTTHLRVSSGGFGNLGRAHSETPSSTGSIVGDTTSFNSVLKRARNSLWVLADSAAAKLRTEAINKDLATIVRTDIVTSYIQRTEKPPLTFDFACHFELIDSAGNELVRHGMSEDDVACMVMQLLNEVKVDVDSDPSGFMAKWFDKLPA